MESNELRVENYIAKDGSIIQATPAAIEYADLFDPIPLTEEWLVRLGFKKERHRDEYVFSSDWFYDARKLLIHEQSAVVFNNRQDSYYAITGSVSV